MMEPLFDKILVEPTNPKETTPGGLYLPESTQKNQPQEGKVVAVGQGGFNSYAERIKPTLKAGDKVLYVQTSGVELKQEGKTVLLMRECDVLVRLK